MASMESLEDVLQEEVKDLYDAEKQLTKALPKLAKKATADALKDALESHLRETERHVARLEQVFEHLEMPVRGKKCTGMKNLLSEGADMIGALIVFPGGSNGAAWRAVRAGLCLRPLSHPAIINPVINPKE